MPTINLTNNTTLNLTASSADGNATLNRYLGEVLTFRTPPSFDAIADQSVKDVDASGFPITLSATGSGKFAVEKSTLNVQLAASASLGVLKDDDKTQFLGSLKLPDDFAAGALVSFALQGSLSLQVSGSVSDFSFGVTEGATVTLTSYAAAADTETFGDAVTNAVEALTIPHDLDDLTSLPVNSVCQLDASSSLKFTASVSYSFLNNPLASANIENLPAIAVNASASATIEATATHTGDHKITIARVSDRMLHLSVGLTNTDDFETSLTVSAGLTADLGSHDALAFLLDKFSPNSAQEMKTITQELPAKASDLSADIKSAIDGAVSSSFQASFKIALDDSESEKRVFLYEIDLKALDATSTAALQTALSGDFTTITGSAGPFAGITVLDSALTTSSKVTHSMGLHLLGIFNFATTNQFLQSSKVDFTTDKHDIVLSDETTEIATDNLAPDKLREIVVKEVTLTLPASANTPASDNAINMVFFDREASIGASKLRQFVNVLRAIGSPDAPAASSVLAGAKFGTCSEYLGLTLTAPQCRQLFIDSSGAAFPWTLYLEEFRDAETTILTGDEDSASRLKLFAVDDIGVWNGLKDAGSAPTVIARLKDIGFQEAVAEQLVPDVFAALWWSNAMAGYAKALHDGQSLVDAGKNFVMDSNLGFNEPWAILASWNILGNPAIIGKFTRSPEAPELVQTA